MIKITQFGGHLFLREWNIESHWETPFSRFFDGSQLSSTNFKAAISSEKNCQSKNDQENWKDEEFSWYFSRATILCLDTTKMISSNLVEASKSKPKSIKTVS